MTPPFRAPGIRFGEDCPIEEAPVLSEEAAAMLAERTQSADRRLADAGKAKYKIELFFSHARRLHAPSPGLMCLWESAAQLHGGGDQKIYWCPSKVRGKGTCEAIIPASGNGYGFLHCPACKTVWRGEDVLGELIGNFSTRTWAAHVVHFFGKLGHNADIYVKHPHGDLRDAAHREQARQQMGEHLDRVRRSRVLSIYPLARIVEDTGNGGDLFSRVLSFLQS